VPSGDDSWRAPPARTCYARVHGNIDGYTCACAAPSGLPGVTLLPAGVVMQVYGCEQLMVGVTRRSGSTAVGSRPPTPTSPAAGSGQ